MRAAESREGVVQRLLIGEIDYLDAGRDLFAADCSPIEQI